MFQLKLPVEISTIIEISDPVYTFCEVMDSIDLRKYLAAKESRTGRKRYNSEILLKVTLFAFMEYGYASVRAIEKLCKTDIRFMWLLQDESAPSHMTIDNFMNDIIFNKKYDSRLSRYVLLAYYTVVIASVTVFMVSCNFHGIGLSISMCYLFVIMVAPTYKLSDTILICVFISVSWWLPSVLPYSDNYNLFKHFLLRFAIVAGFISVRSVFIRKASNERRITEMRNSFIKLAYICKSSGKNCVAANGVIYR